MSNTLKAGDFQGDEQVSSQKIRFDALLIVESFFGPESPAKGSGGSNCCGPRKQEVPTSDGTGCMTRCTGNCCKPKKYF